ncbi:hypothetical protein INS49_000656 [Diaporthe citri]|uniref:uncharacterized protein n=1 Tax=Diaporthe citri TaxID=83186 RepID=UPI001C7FFD90|nr:uncharacterized protein INS49_000656 [Diaporthe citri]KAG6366479.1 hypothetical protein INS49_000656 [Diaporthe citri]
MSDRSTRRNPRKKSRYESSSDDGHSAICSEKGGDSDSGGSYAPASTASSRRRSSSRSHHHSHHHRDHSRSSHRSHSHRHHQRSHRHSHHHHRRQKLLGPAEDGEKAHDGGMALAVREDYQVQTVPRAHHRGDDSDDGEEVYDHRPKPLSHRGHSHAGVSSAGGRGGARAQQASDADKGFFMAAAALAVSLIICCGEADND